MCGGYYEEELEVSEVKWYARGEMGEYVLSLVESLSDKMITSDAFIYRLRQAGLSDQEIMDVYCEDVLEI
jgi:hypothetical protein